MVNVQELIMVRNLIVAGFGSGHHRRASWRLASSNIPQRLSGRRPFLAPIFPGERDDLFDAHDLVSKCIGGHTGTGRKQCLCRP